MPVIRHEGGVARTESAPLASILYANAWCVAVGIWLRTRATTASAASTELTRSTVAMNLVPACYVSNCGTAGLPLHRLTTPRSFDLVDLNLNIASHGAEVSKR